jgi:hypothetical protein
LTITPVSVHSTLAAQYELSIDGLYKLAMSQGLIAADPAAPHRHEVGNLIDNTPLLRAIADILAFVDNDKL